MLRRSTIRSPQLKKKKRKLLYIKAGVAAVFLVLFVAGLSALSKLDALQIKKVEGEGTVIVTNEDMWEKIDTATQGNYLHLFSKKNVFLFPTSKALAAVTASFPILEGARIDREGFNTIRIKASERTPTALWCKLANGAFTDECFFLDDGGYVYSEAPEFKGEVYLKYYGGILNDDPIGQSFLSPERYKALLVFSDGVKAMGLAPVLVRAKADGDFEMTLKDGGMLLMSESEGLDRALANLETVLADSSRMDERGSAREIDYIDLRFGNKIFFKFR